MSFTPELAASPDWDSWAYGNRQPCGGWLHNAQARQEQRPLHSYAMQNSYNTCHLTNLAAPEFSGHNMMPSYLDQPSTTTPMASGVCSLRHPYANPMGGTRDIPLKTESNAGSFSIKNAKAAKQTGHQSSQKCPDSISLAVPSKTISRNETVDPSKRVEFATAIDDLMRAVQTKAPQEKGEDQVPSPAASHAASPVNSTTTFITASNDAPITQLQEAKASSKAKKFKCSYPNCEHTSNQIGNLKAHQNTYHMATLLDLTKKFTRFGANETIPHEYRELYDYFTTLYKNTNKGIKGRGKSRKVAGSPKGPRRATVAPKKASMMPSPPSSVCEPRTPVSEPEYAVSGVKPFPYGVDFHASQLMTPRNSLTSVGHLSPEYPHVSSPDTGFDESRRSSYCYL
ncbi:hypothetical protein N3K66_006745 [Trichothecium roseum]|uniref:Uncharacterized protein n=1 Tax=Trichothecium roseum TaxID=47278 RepID=A0ACC0UW53_9HYPO|nr:hypothetical protein N3K66_006745 [Trichothecium roseum]